MFLALNHQQLQFNLIKYFLDFEGPQIDFHEIQIAKSLHSD